MALRLEAGSPVADALQLRIRVRGSGIGIGIPATQRSRIFQHFTEADHSEAPAQGKPRVAP